MFLFNHIRGALIILIATFLYNVLPWPLAAGPGEGFQYLSPRPGAKLVSPQSDIVIRPGEVLAPLNAEAEEVIRVSGSRSGAVRGELILAEDSKTLIFRQERAFQPGETVTVRLRRGLPTARGTEIGALDFRFTVSATPEALRRQYYETQIAERLATTPPAAHQPRSQSKMNFFGNDSLPPDFPAITVDTLDSPAPGYLFLGLWRIDLAGGTAGPAYITMMDDHGTPVLYRRYAGTALDFKRQRNGLLSYYVGPAGPASYENSRFYALDETFAIVDSFRTGNGYVTDVHDFLLLPNGHALMMSYDPQTVRMDTIVPGGNPNATVIGLIIQELDAAKNVIFQWRSWDHFQITDADSNVDLTAATVDYAHGNSIEVDHDGHLLISSRNMSEITKIDRQSGALIYRWGGKRNQFTYINDDRGFAYQHHLRRTAAGTYTLFDNGNFLDPEYSSALEYAIDEANLTATLLWSYRDPAIYSAFMGSAQRLANGHTLIGWGGTFPSLTEVRPDGSPALQISFPENYFSYRALRFAWQPGIFSADPAALHFDNPLQAPDTAWVSLQNNTAEDLTLTTAVTRSAVFTVAAELPLLLPANGAVQLPVIFAPPAPGSYSDVLTVRADRETEGVGGQVALSGEYGPSGLSDADGPAPQRFALAQNYPNPFNPETVIRYQLSVASDVELAIYDVLGRKVVTLVAARQGAGRYQVRWNGRDRLGWMAGAGVYYYRLSAGGLSAVRKLVLLR